ncbi:MAG TPA: twin-arginine translocase subunit TatB, partial [Alphaproteobacteria bacterium]|nr:twin-arginine translocase subunit TatB [Alphaproteobacteria bacterium]
SREHLSAMFDIGWQELFVVAVLAIIVVGPKDMPRAIRTVTGWLRKAKDMARDFQSGMEDIVREAELEDIRKEAEKAAGFNLEDAAANFNMEDEIRKTIDPTGEMARELEDLSKVTDEDETTEEDAAEEEETGRAAAANDAAESGKKTDG